MEKDAARLGTTPNTRILAWQPRPTFVYPTDLPYPRPFSLAIDFVDRWFVGKEIGEGEWNGFLPFFPLSFFFFFSTRNLIIARVNNIFIRYAKYFRFSSESLPRGIPRCDSSVSRSSYAAAENIREGKFAKISWPLDRPPTLKFCQTRQPRLFVRTVTA